MQSQALTPDKDRIVGFIRDTLGCGCPAEVFEHIEDDRLPGPPCPYRRLAVGGRLLIYLVTESTDPVDAGLLAELLAAGRVERDHLGMNRFRLVVAAGDPDTAASKLSPPFKRLRGSDDRLHLHVVPRDQTPS